MESHDSTSHQAGEKSKLVLCPYCGHTQQSADRCEICRGLFEPLSRRATQIAMGPWYIRDKNNPFRPGCSYEVLVRQIESGKVKPHTVLRGPTTRQFWSVARNVAGVAHLLGYCHACGAHVGPNAKACPKCEETFHAVRERNELGLLFETAAEAAAAQRLLEAEQRMAASGKSADAGRPEPPAPSKAAAPTGEQATSADAPKAGADLLDSVLGKVSSEPTATTETATRQSQGSGVHLLEPRAPLLPARRGDTAEPAAPETLDFSPTQDAPDTAEPTLDIASTKRSATMTWLLVTLNVLVLVLIALLIWSKARPEASTQLPVTDASSLFADQAPTIDRRDSSDEAAPRPTQTPESDRSAEVADPPPAEPIPSNPNLRQMSAAMERARRLEEQGRLEESLAVLRELSTSLSQDQRPIGLDSQIRRLEDRIAHRKTASFFGIPTR